MAKEKKAQEAQAETIEASEFESLLKKTFKPKTDQAKDTGSALRRRPLPKPSRWAICAVPSATADVSHVQVSHGRPAMDQ